MKNRPFFGSWAAAAAAAVCLAGRVFAQTATNGPLPTNSLPSAEQLWNLHMEATYIGQWHPAFPAQYSGPNSLNNQSQTAETSDLDLFLGFRLWPGAEFHLDALFWQGFGFNHTLGLEAFPNAEAYKIGSQTGNVAPVRVFIRQNLNLGGGEQDVPDDQLHLAGKQDVSRITLTVGEFSVLDVFDNNTYAGDADLPVHQLGVCRQRSLGLSGQQHRLHQRVLGGIVPAGLDAALRLLPGAADSKTAWPRTSPCLDAWGMVTEFERRFVLRQHPGALRLLAYLNRADMGSYAEAVDNPARPANIIDTRSYRLKYGFCLNGEYELCRDVGLFTRLGWNDGQSENWSYADVAESGSAGHQRQGDFLAPAQRQFRPGRGRQRHLRHATAVFRRRRRGHPGRRRRAGLRWEKTHRDVLQMPGL